MCFYTKASDSNHVWPTLWVAGKKFDSPINTDSADAEIPPAGPWSSPGGRGRAGEAAPCCEKTVIIASGYSSH